MQNTEPEKLSKAAAVHVAVAVIERFQAQTTSSKLTQRQILISKRAKDVHQGGFWEFPGGKVEANEVVVDALSRELFEELGITVKCEDVSPLIQIAHDYGDKQVLLDVYTVHRFDGEASGREGQPIKWVVEADLLTYSFPEANKSIVSACRLPYLYVITPEYDSIELAIECVGKLVEQQTRLFLFRQPSMSPEHYQECVQEILQRYPAAKESMLLSGEVSLLRDFDVAGIHLPFRYAEVLDGRRAPEGKWLGVSCHNECEIKQAEKLGADFITLSPVLATASHPEALLMGWEHFAELVKQTNIPVYALGGMIDEHQQQAANAGAKGIAGIRFKRGLL